MNIDKMRSENIMYTGLAEWCRAIPESQRDVIVQVGVWTGEASVLFARYFKTVIDIDPWYLYESGDKHCVSERGFSLTDVYNEYLRRVKQHKNVTHIVGWSVKEAEDMNDKSIDACYEDAIHEYKPLHDSITAWLPKIKPGDRKSVV